MADHVELLNLATKLGQGIAAHPTVRDYHAAKQTARADAEAQKLLRDYQEHLSRVQQLEAAHQPIEVGDKQKLRTLEQAMAGNDALKALMRTQANYVELMNKINEAMDAPLLALDSEPAK